MLTSSDNRKSSSGDVKISGRGKEKKIDRYNIQEKSLSKGSSDNQQSYKMQNSMIFDQIPDGFAVTDRSHKILWANKRLTSWFDKDPLDEAVHFAQQNARYNGDAPLLILTFDPTLGFGAALA